MPSLPRLYAIADRQCGDPLEISRQLVAGGAQLVQLRDKQASARSLYEEAQALLAELPRDVLVVVNDRVDVALLAGAHGVHLGQRDLPALEARALLGPHALIGVSTHTLDEVRAALDLPVDYIAMGPVFPTGSKRDAKPVVGLEGIEAACRLSTVPVVAIGGIRLESVGAVLASGAHAVAVIADLGGSGCIESRTREYLEVLGEESL